MASSTSDCYGLPRVGLHGQIGSRDFKATKSSDRSFELPRGGGNGAEPRQKENIHKPPLLPTLLTAKYPQSRQEVQVEDQLSGRPTSQKM